MDLPVLKPERGIGSGKGRNAVFVFGREQRAGDIDKATAGADQTRTAGEHFVLRRDIACEHLRRQPPTRIRASAPGACAAAGRIDQHAIGTAFKVRQNRIGLAGPVRRKDAGLKIADAGALGTGDKTTQAAGINVAGINLTAIAHHGGERKRLAATACTEVHYLFAWFHGGEQAGKLRAFILNFYGALAEKLKARKVGANEKTDAPGRMGAGLRRYALPCQSGERLVTTMSLHPSCGC